MSNGYLKNFYVNLSIRHTHTMLLLHSHIKITPAVTLSAGSLGPIWATRELRTNSLVPMLEEYPSIDFSYLSCESFPNLTLYYGYCDQGACPKHSVVTNSIYPPISKLLVQFSVINSISISIKMVVNG